MIRPLHGRASLTLPDHAATPARAGALPASQRGGDDAARAPGRRRLADLLPRVASGLVLAAAALTAVWQGGLLFAAIWFGAALAVGLEWQNLIATERPRLRFGIVAAALALTAFFAAEGRFAAALATVAAAGSMLAAAASPRRRLWAGAGLAYAGALLMAVFALYAAFGPRALFWLFATVWGTDVFAYFAGRLIGGPKLWPQVSPSKTWSGTLAGILAGALIGAVVATHGLDAGRLAPPVFALGLVAALVSQAGDIFESMVKRRFGAKDSSALIPGHGGFMDRLDGFVAAAAFTAAVSALPWLSGAAHGLFGRMQTF